MDGDSSFIWLRPAIEMEILFDEASKIGAFVIVYGLTLRSVVPLSDNHIKEALQHIFRKIATLRMCFRKRGDTLWACDMNREQLDFQLTEEQNLVTAVEALLQYRFPTTEGPLWCARLLPQGAAARCSRPELLTAFPHSRTLVLANHHGIADGNTNMFIINAFLRVLNDVIAGKPVDDAAQLGKLVVGEETKAILTKRMEEILKDKDTIREVMEATKKFHEEKKLIPRAYPMSRDPNFKPEVVLIDLDKETSQSFIKRCKKEGVTVNSGLIAVFNVGLVDFVREGGLEQDAYRTYEIHAVSLRRFWSGDTNGTLGMHAMPMQHTVSTPAKWRENFWDYARLVHISVSQSIQERDAIMYVINLEDGWDPEKYFEERPLPECDYGTSNMGNADLLISMEGQQVQLAHLLRTASCWNDPMYYLFHTLHGCLLCSLTYANDILTREGAQKLMDKTFENLKTVSQV